jgi:hypothetical protein
MSQLVLGCSTRIGRASLTIKIGFQGGRTRFIMVSRISKRLPITSKFIRFLRRCRCARAILLHLVQQRQS